MWKDVSPVSGDVAASEPGRRALTGCFTSILRMSACARMSHRCWRTCSTRSMRCILLLEPRVPYIFFDEIQEIPEWGAFLRRVVDTEKATVYVTGSSSKMLSSELKSEFRGRSLVRELFPLSFRNTFDIRRGAFSSQMRPFPRAMQRCFDII